MFIYELSGCGLESTCSHLNFRFRACLSKESLDIQPTIECGSPLKRVRDMIWTYSEKRSCWSLFFNKAAGLRPNISKFYEQLFYRIPPVAAYVTEAILKSWNLTFGPPREPEGSYEIGSVRPSVLMSVRAFSWNCISSFY